MREYESCFSPLIRDFITYRLASGRWNEASYEPNMRVFDRYCKVRYPDAVELTQEMVDSWCAKRGSETNNSCRSRIYVVHSFTLYLSERGLSSVHPPEIPRKERSVYIPYAFTQEEIQLFFKACDSMTALMRRYDSAIRKWFPNRTYFFPAPGDQPHPHTWVEKNFRRVWDAVSKDRRATAYAFRHHYAAANINQWIGGGFSFDDRLTYLSKSMGHTTLESTRYYYSIVPALSQVLLEKTEAGFNELVPEVEDDDWK